MDENNSHYSDKDYCRFDKIQQDFITSMYFDKDISGEKIANTLGCDKSLVYDFIRTYKRLNGYRWVRWVQKHETRKRELDERRDALQREVRPLQAEKPKVGRRKKPVVVKLIQTDDLDEEKNDD